MNWTYDHYQYLERELDKRAETQRQLQAMQTESTPLHGVRGKCSTRKGAA